MSTSFPITIHANGKLLITGEYFVLNGAKAFALPTQFGQKFSFTPNTTDHIHWSSLDCNNNSWFEGKIETCSWKVLESNQPKISDRLVEALIEINKLNSNVFKNGWKITSKLEFPENWGLGSSSTLIYALAKWANINPYQLLANTFGGSGYDIACAGSDKPIFFSLKNNNQLVNDVQFNCDFKQNLYFVYLGRKQNSREGIKRFQQLGTLSFRQTNQISLLSEKIVSATSLKEFEKIIEQHEEIIATALQLTKVKDFYFKDYWGEVKSLGAWGGDFILVTSNKSKEETVSYFHKKKFTTILTYNQMIKDG